MTGVTHFGMAIACSTEVEMIISIAVILFLFELFHYAVKRRKEAQAGYSAGVLAKARASD